jgi:chromosome segregation ATPase
MGREKAPVLPETVEELKAFALRQYRELHVLKQECHTKTRAIQEKAKAIREKDKALQEKSEAIQDKDKALQEKSETLEDISSKYQDKSRDYLEIYEKYKILQHAFFGRSSEKWSVDEKLQARLFNEAELAADEADSAAPDQTVPQPST